MNLHMINIIRIIKSLYRKYILRKVGIKIGPNSMIFPPFRIEGVPHIYVGANTSIREYSWIAAYDMTGSIPRLTIGDNTSLGYNSHIICTRSVTIGNNVLFANGVYISDNLHAYEDITIPIINQNIVQKQDVIIGDGSWIGEHACIIGAKVGKHCVVGANSVVTKDVPDYCVVGGVPAKILKMYDNEKKVWRRVNNFGEFI